MSPENDSADMLLQDLENLHRFLGTSKAQEAEVERPEDKLSFNLDEYIPTLADEVSLEEDCQLEAEIQESDQPLTNDEISIIVDSLVAEYLPKIEKKLRKRLLAALIF